MPSETSQFPSTAAAARVPPHVFFIISAIFHYLGPAFAVLLFAHVPPLGVAWLRNATAAGVFALWRNPGGNGARSIRPCAEMFSPSGR